MHYFILTTAIFLAASVAPLRAQFFGLPESPRLSPRGYAFVMHAETGGPSQYNPRPEWPGGYSGVTIGVGYDCGYVSKQAILSDWNALEGEIPSRLSQTSGIRGVAARSEVFRMQTIQVPWENAIGVFEHVDIPRYYVLTARTFPALETLAPDARAALVSLVFNRGSSLQGPSRLEMRQIQKLVPLQDYKGMASHLRKMSRVWAGTSIERGMRNRREGEAMLMESCVEGGSNG